MKKHEIICQNPSCINKKRALVMLGDKFVCGECYTKFNKNKNKLIYQLMSQMMTE